MNLSESKSSTVYDQKRQIFYKSRVTKLLDKDYNSQKQQ